MKTIQFQGRELSAIALGTTAFGSRYSAEQAAEAIDFVRSQGVNVIDTARVYGYNAPGGGFGYSESIIGQ
jgi:aryl-alcohol dehydrogenase-like predicted oxidoreductase